MTVGLSKYPDVPSDTEQFADLKSRVRQLAIAVRSALSLRTITLSERLTVSGGVVFPPVEVIPDQTNTVNIDASIAHHVKVALSAPVALTVITGGIDGQELVLSWEQDGIGTRTYAWPANTKFAGGTAPTDTTPDTRTSVRFVYDGGTWYEFSRVVGVG